MTTIMPALREYHRTIVHYCIEAVYSYLEQHIGNTVRSFKSKKTTLHTYCNQEFNLRNEPTLYLLHRAAPYRRIKYARNKVHLTATEHL